MPTLKDYQILGIDTGVGLTNYLLYVITVSLSGGGTGLTEQQMFDVMDGIFQVSGKKISSLFDITTGNPYLSTSGLSIAQLNKSIRDYLNSGGTSWLSILNDNTNNGTSIVNWTNQIRNGTIAQQNVTGATDIYINNESAGASGIQYVVTAGKIFYLTDISFGRNMTVAGYVNIRDSSTGTVVDKFTLPTGISEGIRSYKKPKKISTSVYFEVITGTFLSSRIVFSGFEL